MPEQKPRRFRSLRGPRVAPRRLAPEEKLDLIGHLDELRRRLLICLGAIAVAFVVTYIFHAHIVRALNRPLDSSHLKPVTFGVVEPFMTSIKVSLYAALGVSMPIVLWQLWSFVAPIFQRGTQRAVYGYVFASTVLAAAGIAFGYLLALPAAVHFLVHYDDSLYHIEVRASDYYSFAALAILACGIVFELPIVIISLVRFGVLTTQKLRSNRRIGYVVMAVVAVCLPGVDPITTTFEMIPLMLLYEGTIWAAVLLDRGWKRSEWQRAAAEFDERAS